MHIISSNNSNSHYFEPYELTTLFGLNLCVVLWRAVNFGSTWLGISQILLMSLLSLMKLFVIIFFILRAVTIIFLHGFAAILPLPQLVSYLAFLIIPSHLGLSLATPWLMVLELKLDLCLLIYDIFAYMQFLWNRLSLRSSFKDSTGC